MMERKPSADVEVLASTRWESCQQISSCMVLNHVCDHVCVDNMMELNDVELMQRNEEEYANEPQQVKSQCPECMRHHDASLCKALDTIRGSSRWANCVHSNPSMDLEIGQRCGERLTKGAVEVKCDNPAKEKGQKLNTEGLQHWRSTCVSFMLEL